VFVPRNVIYALHYALHEKSIIDWGYLISSEVSFQLSNLKKTRKFYMTSYLIFAIAYGHVFEDFPREKHVDFKLEPIYAWYSVLYRHKAQYNFYPVHNNFISEFKKLIFGHNTSRLSLEATTFLSGKGFMKLLKNLLLSGCLVVKRSLFFSHSMYQIDSLPRKCADSTRLGPISSMIRGKNNSYPYHGKLGNSL
jgi:hypothetical protein